MAQKNTTPAPSSRPAASGSGGPSPTKPIRKIAAPAQPKTQVGPKNAPYHQK